MKIGLNTYSFRNELKSGALSLSQVLEICSKMGTIEGIELFDGHLRASDGPDLRSQVQVAKEEIEGLGLELFALGPHIRFRRKGKRRAKKEPSEFKRWIDAAADNDIPNLRVQGGGPIGLFGMGPPEQGIQEYEKILPHVLPYAEERGIKLGLETHGKYSSEPDFLRLYADKWGDSPHIAIIFDWGNFASNDELYRALDVAKEPKLHAHNHVKMYEFDPETGMETGYGAYKIVETFRKEGFSDYFSIEYAGSEDAVVGVFKSAEVLKYCISEKKNPIDLETDPLSFLPT